MAEHKHHHKPGHSHLIAVVGATGHQGGSVVRSLLHKDGHHHHGPTWQVRALVRNPESAEAKKLATLGAEVVQCDYTNKEQLRRAFHGAYGVFAVTVPDQQETAHGRLMIAAAHEEKVEHFVWSGLENVEALSNGKYHVSFFTHKAKVEDRLREIHGMAWTSVYAGFFFQNFQTIHPPHPGPNNTFEIRLPVNGDKPLPFLDPSTAVGPVVCDIFADKNKYNTKVVPIVSQEISMKAAAAALSHASGKHINFVSVTADEFVAANPENNFLREVSNMWQYVDEFGYYAHGRDTHLSRKIDPHATTLEGWLQATRWHL